MVFHRFLNTEGVGNRISITFNGDPVTGADPFLTRHPATRPMTEQLLRVNGEEIRVKPYILPFASKLSAKDIRSIGGTDDLRQQQGFYIYRNRRLIIWGTWFRLIRQNELGKLARVRVDIPNSLDSIWKIDIKKSTAALPSFIKKNLADIVRNAVGRSERVYRYRGRNIQTDALTHIWEPFDQRGVFRYRINRDGVLQNRKRIILIGKRGNYRNFYPEIGEIHPECLVSDVLSDLPAIAAGGGEPALVGTLPYHGHYLYDAHIKERDGQPVTLH